jgi:DNA-binding MarR family transcriptional regulator
MSTRVEGLEGAHADLLFDTFFGVARDLHERTEEVLGEMGLSYRAYALLEHLQEAGGSLSRNSGGLDEQGGSVDDVVLDPLEKQGLIQRVHDGGKPRLELTTRGLDRALEASTRLQGLARDFRASFEDAERLRLGRLLSKLAG